MKAETVFRLLLVASLVVGLAGTVLDLFVPSLMPRALTEAYESASSSEALTADPMLLGGLAFGLAIVGVASLIGLFLFRHWARTVSVFVTVAGSALTAVLGPNLQSGLATALIEVSFILWGMVLAMAYLAPLNERFRQ